MRERPQEYVLDIYKLVWEGLWPCRSGCLPFATRQRAVVRGERVLVVAISIAALIRVCRLGRMGGVGLRSLTHCLTLGSWISGRGGNEKLALCSSIWQALSCGSSQSRMARQGRPGGSRR